MCVLELCRAAQPRGIRERKRHVGVDDDLPGTAHAGYRAHVPDLHLVLAAWWRVDGLRIRVDERDVAVERGGDDDPGRVGVAGVGILQRVRYSITRFHRVWVVSHTEFQIGGR